MQICYVFCSSEKGCYAHLGKQYSYSWNNNCVLACSLLTRKVENTIFSRAKEELQVAVGLLRGYVGYQISNNAHKCVCVCVCVCACARVCAHANKGAHLLHQFMCFDLSIVSNMMYFVNTK